MKKIIFLKAIFLLSFFALTTNAQIVTTGSGGSLQPNASASNLNVGIGTNNPSAALHIMTTLGTAPLFPVIKLDRNDGTNQGGLLSVGISGNGFASGLLGGGSAYFKLEDPYGNSANSDMGFGTNGLAAQMVIKHNGFVGIGTELPTANFHSIGRARLESLPTSSSNTDVITTDALGNLSSQPASSLFSGGSGWLLAGNTTAAGDFIGTLNANPFNVFTNNVQRTTVTPTGEMGIGTITPMAQLQVTSVPFTAQSAIIANGKSTGVYGEATDMTVGQTVDGIAAGWVEAVGVFGKGTYATHSGNGNVYGVVGSATAQNPLNNIGVYGEAKSAIGYNSGVLGSVTSTTGAFNTGVGGSVILNSSAAWNRAIAGYAPLAPNHFAGYFDGKVAIVDGTQANNYVFTSDANGLGTWKDVCTLPCFATAFTTDWHTNGNATAAGDFIGTLNANPFNVYTSNSQRMTIDATGKMGLGTVTPTAALHLLTGSNPGMLPPVFKIDRNDGTNQGGLISIGISGNSFASGLLGGGSACFKLTDPYGNSSNSDIGFGTNGLAAQMVIKHSGNVGIGIETPVTRLDVQGGAVRIGNTCTPVGYNLYVEKGILAEKVKVAVNCSSAWADYVFANDYKLQPLSEVEKFIKENKHLPNVPSAETMVTEGLDLGKMQAKQMEKIEELTLYLIEMKKEIEILKIENKALKTKN